MASSSPLLPFDEGEAMGHLEALSWIKQLGLHKIKIEMAAKLVVDAMKTSKVARFVFHDFIHACKRELISFLTFPFEFVNRAANEKAHRIAKVVRSFSSPYC
ncbi:hypothetical protein ACS0TY_005368 [Phlomoides rotata]